MSSTLEKLTAFVDTQTALTSPTFDTFGRGRVSMPHSVFDSKLIGDKKDLFWDEQEVSGSGTSGNYSAFRGSQTLTVSENTAGRRVRQTYQSFNYQPGKAQLIKMTYVGFTPVVGCGFQVGYYNDNNGLFFKQDGLDLSFVIRSSVSGSPVDRIFPKSEWNVTSLDTLDTSKSQILWIDFESLQVGTVRFAYQIGGLVQYAHIQTHSNVLDSAYFSTPNLPLRYEIWNDGNGPESNLECICNTVISEGGIQETGITRGASTQGTHLDADSAGTLYALIGYRLKSSHLDSIVRLNKLSLLSKTNDNLEWQIRLNPTIAGTFTYSDQTHSAVQVAKGVTANTVTDGYIMGCGFASAASGEIIPEETLRYIGSSISGVRDQLVLCVRPLSSNADIEGSISWKETS